MCKRAELLTNNFRNGEKQTTTLKSKGENGRSHL